MQIKFWSSDPRISVVSIDKNRIATTKVGETCEVDPDCVVMLQAAERIEPEQYQTFELQIDVVPEDQI